MSLSSGESEEKSERRRRHKHHKHSEKKHESGGHRHKTEHHHRSKENQEQRTRENQEQRTSPRRHRSKENQEVRTRKDEDERRGRRGDGRGEAVNQMKDDSVRGGAYRRMREEYMRGGGGENGEGAGEYGGEDEEGLFHPKRVRDLSNRLEEFSYDKPVEETVNKSDDDEDDDYDIGQEIADNVTRVKSVVTRMSPQRKRHQSGGESDGDRRKRGHIGDSGGDERRKRGHSGDKVADKDSEYMANKRKVDDPEASITTRTGGAYIPPARLRLMQAAITDKASAQYQRLAWETLKKSLNGIINKVNVSNIVLVVRELFQENIVRGRGLLCRSIMQAQAASPTFTHVYAALVAILNTKFPQTGELLLKRLSIQFKKGFKRNDKPVCLASSRFIAHLVNQQVSHEILALEILTLLLENASDDSVEVAVGFLKECGQKLTSVSPRGINAIFERLRIILHEALIDKRVQYMIEVMFAIRKDGFKDHPSLVKELDVVDEDDQCTHMITLDEAVDPEDGLNVFKLDPDYLANEEAYKTIRKDLLDEGSSSEEESSDGSGSSSDDDDDDDDDDGDKQDEDKQKTVIIDQTETNLVAFRRTVYLTIQSSLTFEECAHKLLRMNLKPGQEGELCNMILDCCAQQRTYEKFYGNLAERFCLIDKKYIPHYQQMFGEQYDTIHRLETNKLRNVAKFFAHLLFTDAISWEVLEVIKLNEEDTTSSSRIFIKIMFQELVEFMGLSRLNTRLKDVTLQAFFEGLFPRDKPKNTRFAVNFFTSIGLGGLTDELREHLNAAPSRPVAAVVPQTKNSGENESTSSSDDSSEDSSDSSDSDDSSSSEESSSEEEEEEEESSRKNKKKNKKRAEESKTSHHRDRSDHRDSDKHLGDARGKRDGDTRGKDGSRKGKGGDEPTTAQMKLLALAYGKEAVKQSIKNREKQERRGERGGHRDRKGGEERDRGEERQRDKRGDRHKDRKRDKEGERERESRGDRERDERKKARDSESEDDNVKRKNRERERERKRYRDTDRDRKRDRDTDSDRKRDRESGGKRERKGERGRRERREERVDSADETRDRRKKRSKRYDSSD